MTYDKTKYFKIIDDGKLTTSQLLQKCKDKFPVYSYWNNKELNKEFPVPKEPTTRYFKKKVEADENLKNISADDLEKMGIRGITLRERILLELSYFNETGKHLDIDNITLCSGSRNSGGDVPYACWRDDKFEVYWRYCDSRSANLRSREAVSLNPESSFPTDNIQVHIDAVKKAGYKIIKEI